MGLPLIVGLSGPLGRLLDRLDWLPGLVACLVAWIGNIDWLPAWSPGLVAWSTGLEWLSGFVNLRFHMAPVDSSP